MFDLAQPSDLMEIPELYQALFQCNDNMSILLVGTLKAPLEPQIAREDIDALCATLGIPYYELDPCDFDCIQRCFNYGIDLSL